MENQGLPRALVTGIAGLIFIVLFGSSMFVTIEPGENGVLFKKFGGGLDKEKVTEELKEFFDDHKKGIKEYRQNDKT